MRRVVTPRDLSLLTTVVPPAPYATYIPGPAPTPPQPVLTPDDYLTRVVKYIPAEIVAVFVTVRGIIDLVADSSTFLYWIVFGFLVIMTVVYSWKSSTVKGLPPAYTQVVVSTVSFVIWVFALGEPFSSLGWYRPIYGSLLLILYTLIPPLLIGK